MSILEKAGTIIGMMFLMGLFLYKLETTDVDVWLPGPDSEQYMGGQ